jgi:hypothetical protein
MEPNYFYFWRSEERGESVVLVYVLYCADAVGLKQGVAKEMSSILADQ